jgi:signal transduction histidine kinase
MAQLTVADTGEGIPADYLDKIFDKYQQVAGQHKGGTGLGLTICRYIVESHMGKIWVESAVGKGSRFILTIPKDLKQEVLKTEAHA